MRNIVHLDVFGVAADGRTMGNWWHQSSGWAGWFQVQGGIASPGGTGSPITAVARHAGQLDLFTPGTYRGACSCWWDERGGWRGWFQAAGGVASPGSPVTAVVRCCNHLDPFTLGSDNRVYSSWWHEGQPWAGRFNVSGGIGTAAGQVAAISRIAEHLDLFTVGGDGLVYSTWWDANGGWAGWFQLAVS